MKYTFIISETKLTVTADCIESAKIKVAQLLGVDMGELNNLNPEIFEL